MKFCFVTLCLICSAAASYAQQPAETNSPLAAGDKHAIWLVVPGEDGKTFDVMIRPGDQKWRLLTRRLIGKPAMAVAMGGTLEVIFHDPLGQGAFSEFSPEMMPLPIPSAPSWPGGALPVAICAAPRFGPATQSTLVAMVHQYQPAPEWATTTQASPSTAPAGTTTTSSAAMPKGPGVLQPYAWFGGKWRPLDGALAMEKSFDRAMVTVAGNEIYCLLVSHLGNRLYAADLTDLRWRQVPVGKELLSARPLTVFTLANKLAVLVPAPASEGKVHIKLLILEGPSHFSSSTLRTDKGPYEWLAALSPVAVQTGDQFELIWRDQKYMAASCSAGGEMLAPTEVPVSNIDADIRAQHMYMYFLTGVLMAVLLLLATGPLIRPTPFEVPAQLAPASLFKRGLAAVIDMAPWNLMAGLIVGVFPNPWDTATIVEQGLVERVLYFQALSQSMYVVYCIAAEATIGVTMGKRLMGLRVITDGGAKPNLRSIALRNVVKIVELQWIPLLIVPGQFPLMLLFPLLTAYRLRLGDMLARTAVVQAKTAE